MQIVGASRPMERIATDILGELPLPDKGNRYILVASDYFRNGWKHSLCHGSKNIGRYHC